MPWIIFTFLYFWSVLAGVSPVESSGWLSDSGDQLERAESGLVDRKQCSKTNLPTQATLGHTLPWSTTITYYYNYMYHVCTITLTTITYHTTITLATSLEKYFFPNLSYFWQQDTWQTPEQSRPPINPLLSDPGSRHHLVLHLLNHGKHSLIFYYHWFI